jgi:hypothetical protein
MKRRLRHLEYLLADECDYESPIEEPSAKTMKFSPEILPIEIVHIISTFLSIQDCLTLPAVCSAWSNLVNHADNFWEYKYISTFHGNALEFLPNHLTKVTERTNEFWKNSCFKRAKEKEGLKKLRKLRDEDLVVNIQFKVPKILSTDEEIDMAFDLEGNVRSLKELARELKGQIRGYQQEAMYLEFNQILQGHIKSNEVFTALCDSCAYVADLAFNDEGEYQDATLKVYAQPVDYEYNEGMKSVDVNWDRLGRYMEVNFNRYETMHNVLAYSADNIFQRQTEVQEYMGWKIFDEDVHDDYQNVLHVFLTGDPFDNGFEEFDIYDEDNMEPLEPGEIDEIDVANIRK